MSRRYIIIILLSLSFLLTAPLNTTAVTPGHNFLPDQYNRVHGFSVEITGGQPGTGNEGSWLSVSHGGVSFEVVGPSTGGDPAKDKPLGVISIEEISLVGALTKDRKGMLDWLNGALAGKDVVIDVTFDIDNRGEQNLRTFNYLDCYPTFYQPPDVEAGDHSDLEERIDFQPTYIEGGGYRSPGIYYRQDVGDAGLSGGMFSFEIDERKPELISCEPGSVKFVLKETIGGDKARENRFIWTQYEIGDVVWESWTITKLFDRADDTLSDMYKAFASGSRTQTEKDVGSLSYLDKDGGCARGIDFYGYMPIKYELIKVDAADGKSQLQETMTFAVLRCEYR